MVKRSALIVMALIMMIPSLVVYASDVSEALYTATVRATNTSYTAQRVAVPFDLSTEALIAGYYLNSDLTNVTIQDSLGNDVPVMPAPPGSDEWVMFIQQIQQNSSTNYKFYSGGPAMSPDIYYFPGNAGMTTPDDPSMEPGDDFEIEIAGYFDTTDGVDKRILYKEDALELYISGEGEITARITPSIPLDSSLYLQPSGPGDLTELSRKGAGLSGNWEAVRGEVGSPDTSTYVVTPDKNINYYDLYEIDEPVWPEFPFTITSVEVFHYSSGNSSYNSRGQSQLKLYGVTLVGSDFFISSYAGYQEEVDRPGGGSWSQSDFEDLQLGIKLYQNYSGTAKCAQLYLIINYEYQDEIVLSATDISSGEYTIKISADGTDLSLYIDDVLEDSASLGGDTILDNDNSWEYFLNGSMPYVESLKTIVSGSLVQHIEWEHATTFTDLSGNGNDATPTFRTTPTDPDVSAQILSFGPIASSELTGFTDRETAPIFTTAPTQPDQAYGDMNISLPGADVVNNLLEAGRFPPELFWYPLLFGLVAVMGMVAFHLTRSVMMQSIITGGGVTIVSLGIIGADFWVVIPYVVVAIALLTSRKTVSL